MGEVTAMKKTIGLITANYTVEGIDEQAEAVIEDQNDLEEMGKVYKDPKTGKYYVIEEE